MAVLYIATVVREGSVPTTWDRTLQGPAQAASFLTPLVAEMDREVFVVLMLDTRLRTIGVNVVSVGSLNAALVHPREVFKPAILCNAASILLAHNHPSGDPTPSPEDVALTGRIAAAGELLGIRVVDSLVLTASGAYAEVDMG